MTVDNERGTQLRRRLTVRQVALLAALGYFVLIGGTEAGNLYTPIRSVNALLGAWLIGSWLSQLPRRFDNVDKLSLAALILFLFTSSLSDFPRFSFEAATSATAYAAAFYVARRELADPAGRRAALALIGTVALVLAFVFLIAWGRIWLDWIGGSGVLPPLDLRLPVGPYRNSHFAAMLVALLLPALLLQFRATPPVRVAAWFGVSATALIVLMAGSRTTWLAVGASIVTPTLIRQVRQSKLLAMGLLATLALVGAAAWLGAIDAALARLTTASSIEDRFDIWQAALSQWLRDPLFGFGPGSFGTAFTLSDYFADHAAVGRHPDNAIVQLLVEGGLTGVAGLGIAIAALAVGWRAAPRYGSRFAVMGIILFALLCIANNPSDVANLNAILICWAGMASSPRLAAPTQQLVESWRRTVIAALAIVCGLGAASLLVGSAAFDNAMNAAKTDRHVEVVSQLDIAVRFDPSNAMYRRERGLYHAVVGDLQSAIADLRAAALLNPADATTARALALILMRAGDTAGSLTWAEEAVGLRGTHSENQLTLAIVAEAAGQTATARSAMVEAIRLEPWITAAPSWKIQFPTGSALKGLIDEADDLWGRLDEADPRFRMPQAWLDATLGQPSSYRQPFLVALHRLIGCDPQGALETMFEDPTANLSDAGLEIMIMAGRLAGDVERVEFAMRLAGLRGGIAAVLVSRSEWPATSPFGDPGEDNRLYRRVTPEPPSLGLVIPSGAEGLHAWIQDPVQAAIVGAPRSPLAECSS